jgi:PST family polysaccharide transporter
MQFKRWAAVSFSAQAAHLAVAVPMAAAGLGAWSLVAGGLAIAAVTTAGAWIASPWRPRGDCRLRDVRDLFAFSSGIALSDLAGRVSRGVDVLIAGKFVGSGPLGLYTFSLPLASAAPRQINSVMARVMFPAFARLQDRRAALVGMYLRGSRNVAVVNVPIALMVFFGARPFVTGVLGAKWSEAIVILQILSVYALATGIGGALWGALLKGIGASYLLLPLNVVRAVALGGSVLVGARWGIVGVAAAVAIYGAVFRLVYQAIVNRRMGMSMGSYLKAVGPALVCGAAAFGASAGALHLVGRSWHPLARLGCVFLAVVGSYAVCLRLLFPRPVRALLADMAAAVRAQWPGTGAADAPPAGGGEPPAGS